jgi:hypothetical protein
MKRLLSVVLATGIVFPFGGETSGQLLRFRDRNERRSDSSRDDASRRRNTTKTSQSGANAPRNDLRRLPNQSPGNYPQQPPATYRRQPAVDSRPLPALNYQAAPTSEYELPAGAIEVLPPSDASSLPMPTEVRTDNLPAPQESEPAASNVRPSILPIDPIDSETYRLAGEVVRGLGFDALEQLAADLSTAASEPNVAEQLRALAKKFDQHEVIAPAELEQLMKTAAQSGKLPVGPIGRLPAAVERRVRRTLDTLIGLSEANQILGVPHMSVDREARLPSGTLHVVACPPLGEDQMLLLPGGDVLAGTGGVGDYGVAKVEAAELLGVPIGIGEPMSEHVWSLSQIVDSGILIVNPAENGQRVSFAVGDRTFRLDAGYQQRIAEDKVVVEFASGRNRRMIRYTIHDGTYGFEPTPEGWNLFRKSYRLAVDNRASETEFNYVVGTSVERAGPGELKVHNSSYPLLVRFDRGDGSLAMKRFTEPSTSLVVAVDPENGLWDLFADASNPQPELQSPSTRTNSLAQEALRLERNRLGGANLPSRISTLKPVLDEPNEAANTWTLGSSPAESGELPTFPEDSGDAKSGSDGQSLPDVLPEPAAN